MIDNCRFELMKRKYGHYASWAIWIDRWIKPKDNIGDLSVFNTEKDDSILKELNPNIVLVGLNISRPIEAKLGNFHDPRPQAMDYKIRYALLKSPYWGAYITDIIKDFEQKISGKMMSYLKVNKIFEEENIITFRDELEVIGSNNPEIVAFGRDVFKILNKHFSSEFEITAIPHYSNYVSKEKYRDEVRDILDY